MDGLKNCPFCGREVMLVNGEIWGWHKHDCFLRLTTADETLPMTRREITELFVKAWNTRSTA